MCGDAEGGGRHINYGVREFGMAAIMNGIALHGGFIPYGGTFLTFSDYSRNAIRMAALMKLRVIHVFTHDSIGLGEDGPTHQSVEHAASLRLIPNLDVWRPCDAAETAVAWTQALAHADGPTRCCCRARTCLHRHAVRSRYWIFVEAPKFRGNAKKPAPPFSPRGRSYWGGWGEKAPTRAKRRGGGPPSPLDRL